MHELCSQERTAFFPAWCHKKIAKSQTKCLKNVDSQKIEQALEMARF